MVRCCCPKLARLGETRGQVGDPRTLVAASAAPTVPDADARSIQSPGQAFGGASTTMTFQTLYGGELFCMPDTFGERHALQAWGTCNTSTQQYSIGQPKTVPQVHQRSAAPLWRAPLLQLVRCSARDGRPVLHAGGAEADQQRAEECDERQRVGLQPAAPGSSCPFARGAPDRQTVLSSDLGLARLNRHSSASLARPRCNAQCCSRPMMRSVPSWRGGCCRWTGPLSACLVTTLVVSRGCGAGGSAPTLIPGGTTVRGGRRWRYGLLCAWPR